MSVALTPGRNVLGGPLRACSYDPVTGFFRDGCCRTRGDDIDAACGQLKGQVLDRTRRQAEFNKRLSALESGDAAA